MEDAARRSPSYWHGRAAAAMEEADEIYLRQLDQNVAWTDAAERDRWNAARSRAELYWRIAEELIAGSVDIAALERDMQRGEGHG